MADRVEVSGLIELRETLLKSLPQALQGKASQAALAKAAQPMVRMARSLAPTRKPSGLPRVGKSRPSIRKSIYSARSRESTRTFETRVIGVKAKAFHWRFNEFGRGAIIADKKVLGNERQGFFGKQVRAQPAKPFMRPAFEANKERAIELYKQALQPAIEKVARQSFARSQRRIRKALIGI